MPLTPQSVHRRNDVWVTHCKRDLVRKSIELNDTHIVPSCNSFAVIFIVDYSVVGNAVCLRHYSAAAVWVDIMVSMIQSHNTQQVSVAPLLGPEGRFGDDFIRIETFAVADFSEYSRKRNVAVHNYSTIATVRHHRSNCVVLGNHVISCKRKLILCKTSDPNMFTSSTITHDTDKHFCNFEGSLVTLCQFCCVISSNSCGSLWNGCIFPLQPSARRSYHCRLVL